MTRQRWTHGGILLSGILLGVALAVWKISPIAFLWVGAAMVIAWAFTRFRRRAFAADGRAFIAAASPSDITVLAVWLSGATGAAAHELRHVPGTSRTTGFAALGVAAFLLIAGLLVWWRPLTLTLRPDGVMVRTAFRTHWRPWDETSGPVTGRGQLLYLGGGFRMRFAIGSLTADPSFLGQAIEFYRKHAEHRPAIGTPDEHPRWA